MNQSKNILPNWEDVAKKIKRGKAVLLLGPDALPLMQVKGKKLDYEGDMTFSRLTRTKISANEAVKIAHYYERDNFYMFEDKSSKNDAKETIYDLAASNEWIADEELLRQIVAIPFQMVLNINPDLFIKEAFLRYQINSQFDYFSIASKMPKELRDITEYEPLVYNLCGNVEDENSLILDYHDFFEMMKSMLNDSNIPAKLQRQLKDAKLYILLGFDFERWYFQLLLHYLSRIESPFDKENKVLAFQTKKSDDNTTAFMMKQFNVEYIAPNRDDFDTLYNLFSEQGTLRNIANPLSDVSMTIRNAIINGKFADAFELLKAQQFSIDYAQDNITLLQASYAQWLEAQKHGIEDSRDLNVQINKIRYGLLTLIHKIL